MNPGTSDKNRFFVSPSVAHVVTSDSQFEVRYRWPLLFADEALDKRGNMVLYHVDNMTLLLI